MKYIEGMSMCIKDSYEAINEIDTPATITINCSYELDGFCTNGEGSCDFNDILKQYDADMLNGDNKKK